jgi:hypothetical protein
MKKDFAYNDYTGDSVINRGYEIYDVWKEKRLSSRQIVALAENAVKLFKKRKSAASYIDALAYLFALDTRIKEKYNNILRCLFSFFSWRREIRSFRSLKNALDIPLGETDIRNVIAVEIEKLAEKLENEWNEENDEETHGGKRNGKADDEAMTVKEKEGKQSPEEKAENDTDEKDVNDPTEETAKETAEDISEQTSADETVKENSEQQEAADLSQEESARAEQDEAEQINSEEQTEFKEENNGPGEKAEPSQNTHIDARSYNDAIDSPPLYEEHASNNNSTSKDTSYIDEVLIHHMTNDNASQGTEKNSHQDPLSDMKAGKEAPQAGNADVQNANGNEASDRDDYLYDAMMANNQDVTAQANESMSEAKNEPENKVETAKQINQNTEQIVLNTEQVKQQSTEPMRERIHIDITNDQENEMRRELSSNMTAEEVQAIHDAKTEIVNALLDVAYAQAEAMKMREQLHITGEELGMDAPVEIKGKPEILQVKQSDATLNRK